MCVIFSCQKELPGEEYLEAAQDKHPDGIGVAWPSKQKGMVEFRKGLEVKDLLKLYPILPPTSTVIHFRASSVGGKEKELCHPFPIMDGAPDDMLEGTVPGVLFQNGTWSTWISHMKDGILCSRKKVDFRTSGFWSDARALAWLVNEFGEWILNDYTSTQQMRILTMLPNRKGEITRMFWGDWKDDEKGRWRLSNKEFSLPKAKGVVLVQQPLLPGAGRTTSTSSSASSRTNGEQYWSDISGKWLSPEDWFEENQRSPSGEVPKKAAAPITFPLPAARYTERELVELMCELRGLRREGDDGDGSFSSTSH